MEKARQNLMIFLGRFFRCESLDGDDDIFAAGFVNSLVIVQLIRFLETDFSITVEDDELEIDNFRTVNRILSFIARKTAGAEDDSHSSLASAVDAG